LSFTHQATYASWQIGIQNIWLHIETYNSSKDSSVIIKQMQAFKCDIKA